MAQIIRLKGPNQKFTVAVGTYSRGGGGLFEGGLMDNLSS